MRMFETHAHSSPPALRGPGWRSLARLRRLKRQLEGWLADTGPLLRRVLDIVVASTALVLLSPVMLLAALGILLTSRGPILYGQERAGQHGSPFQMLKLRTMVDGADGMKAALAAQRREATDGVRFKLRRDPRATPVGRILRKLSIDELPQLWNVLMGDMTLIGPRPSLWQEVVKYDARALRRLEVRPGLTCLWQVSGRSDLSFEQQVALDLEYIDRVKPPQELLILARTIPAVLTGRGAY
ncbi:sugar transferase [Hyalangium sp.]|uniref:sugar transferase n=1 Tax=Hyalangium sp. TaxID=2028555 RepID=UPI002D34779D|nr:sugar transferase [Hyalangium sp.]HYI01096.1 sugar transferase [Hyalangium sp.]